MYPLNRSVYAIMLPDSSSISHSLRIVVLGHFYREFSVGGDRITCQACQWGFIWVPWFFMLSGFILTYARLKSKDPTWTDRTWPFVVKRAWNLWPLLVVSLLLSIWNQEGPRYSDWDWLSLPFMMTFTHAWIPRFSENSFNNPTWFLCGTALYW